MAGQGKGQGFLHEQLARWGESSLTPSQRRQAIDVAEVEEWKRTSKHHYLVMSVIPRLRKKGSNNPAALPPPRGRLWHGIWGKDWHKERFRKNILQVCFLCFIRWSMANWDLFFSPSNSLWDVSISSSPRGRRRGKKIELYILTTC